MLRIILLSFLFFLLLLKCTAQNVPVISGNEVCFKGGETIPRPAWLKSLIEEGTEGYFLAETYAGHYGVVNDKLRLISDTCFRNYCPYPIYFHKEKNIQEFYFRQMTVGNKTATDFEGDWVMTDKKGKRLNQISFYKPYAFTFSFQFSLDDGCWIADGRGKWGYLDHSFHWKIQPRYDSIWCYQWDTLNDRQSYIVKENNCFGIIDSGKTIVPCKYKQAIYVYGGYNLLFINPGDTQFYDPYYKKLIPYKFRRKESEKYLLEWNFSSENKYWHNGNYISGQYAYQVARNQILQNREMYRERLQHGEIVSPQLYFPGMNSENEILFEGRNSYAQILNYANALPDPPYIPWYHLFTSSVDSNYFSFASNYSVYESHWTYEYSKASFQDYQLFDPDKPEAFTFHNFFVQGDSCFPVSLNDILTRNHENDSMLRRIIYINLILKKKLDSGEPWKLNEDFLISPSGIFLTMIKTESNGKRTVTGDWIDWKTLSPFLNPAGTFGYKIVKTLTH